MQYELKMTGDLKIQPANELEEIFQNVRMIVTTVKGTVPLDREFGISAEMLDAPMNRQSRLVAEVADAINKFEPRARLLKIKFDGALTDGELNPTLTLEIKEN